MSDEMLENQKAEAERAGGSVEPIKRRKLSHEVADRLLAKIQSGEYSVESLLPSERTLMQHFSVGRPAVREALQGLERMGLISIAHGEGARVLPLTADAVIGQISNMAIHLLNSDSLMIEHMKSARVFFETGMVRLVIETASDSDLDPIARALGENRAAAGSQSEFLASDMAFHRAIAAATGNPIYVATSRATLEWIDTFYSQLVRNPGAETVVIEEHERIFDAILRRDVKAAEEAMTAHLRRANAYHRQQQTAGRNGS